MEKDPVTGVIRGTAMEFGEYPIEVLASNSIGTTSIPLTLAVHGVSFLNADTLPSGDFLLDIASVNGTRFRNYSCLSSIPY